MTMVSAFSNNIVALIQRRDTLNQQRSAQLRAEGPGVCLDKEYRLLCKAINELTAEINKLSTQVKVTF